MTFDYYFTLLFLATVLYFSASKLDWDGPVSKPVRHGLKAVATWASLRYIFFSTLLKIVLVIAEGLDKTWSYL